MKELVRRERRHDERGRETVLPGTAETPSLVNAVLSHASNALLSRALLQRLITAEEARKRIFAAGRGAGTDEDAMYAAIRECADRAALKKDPAVQEELRDELSGHELWRAQLIIEFGAEAGWPKGLWDVFWATEGAGTNEARIFKALRSLNRAEAKALAAAPGVRRMLDDELSGHEKWKVDLLLELGGESGWPVALKEIFAATEGAGTDEDRIIRALGKLSEADAKNIAKLPGVMKMLEDELSGTDLKGVKDMLSGGYAKAIQRHKDNVVEMGKVLADQRANTDPDPLVRNTAEWLAPTSGPPKLKLCVMSPTHDMTLRADKAGEKGQIALFGLGKVYPDDSATYDPRVDENKGIYFRSRTMYGNQGGEWLWMNDPQYFSHSDLVNIFVPHEVQHAADRHEHEKGAEAAYKSPENAWTMYKTEFRAYWITGQFPTTMFSDVKGTGTGSFDNAKQERIFNHLMGAAFYAEYLEPNYKHNEKVKSEGKGFADLVHAYARPEGSNLINSPRIDDFSQALQKCNPNSVDTKTAPVKPLLDAANKLDSNDLAAVNAPEAKVLQEQLKAQLNGTLFTMVAEILGGGTGVLPAWAVVNIGPARRTILRAGAGAGTDEDLIYRTIAAASAAERAEMKTDKVIQYVLEDELSGKDLWRARQYLDYGERKNWPKAVQEQDAK